MSGAITAAMVIAGTIYSAVSASGATKASQAPTVDTSTANTEVANASSSTAAARTQLLETAGGSAGDPLNPSQVSNSKSTVFGN